MLKRWGGFTRFLHDDRICLTNNAAERALRGVALGRRAWMFAGSDRGGQRAVVMYCLIVTAKMNDVDPQAWLADVLARIADIPQNQLHELLPWNWDAAREAIIPELGELNSSGSGSAAAAAACLMAREPSRRMSAPATEADDRFRSSGLSITA